MAFRMLEYMVQIWNRYINKHPKTNTLPAVFPLVVYVSPDGRRWNRPTQLADLIDVDPATRAALGDHLPSLRFLLDDLTTADVTTLRARNLSPETFMMLVLLAIAPGNMHLIEDLKPLDKDIEAVWSGPSGKAELQCMARYIFKVSETSEYDLVPLIERLGPEAREIIMTTADRLHAEGEARAEARAVATWADALLELLSQKFGAPTAQAIATVRGADLDRLRVWTTRVMGADTLDEVFQ